MCDNRRVQESNDSMQAEEIIIKAYDSEAYETRQDQLMRWTQHPSLRHCSRRPSTSLSCAAHTCRT